MAQNQMDVVEDGKKLGAVLTRRWAGLLRSAGQLGGMGKARQHGWLRWVKGAGSNEGCGSVGGQIDLLARHLKSGMMQPHTSTFGSPLAADSHCAAHLALLGKRLHAQQHKAKGQALHAKRQQAREIGPCSFAPRITCGARSRSEAQTGMGPALMSSSSKRCAPAKPSRASITAKPCPSRLRPAATPPFTSCRHSRSG